MIRELGNGRAGTRKRDYVAAMGPAMSCGYDTRDAEKSGVRMVQALGIIMGQILMYYLHECHDSH